MSAQSRQRLYWTNIPGVEQPEDLGILLRDILESGLPLKEKGYTLKANYTNAGAVNGVCGQHFPAPMAAEPVRIGTIESAADNKNFSSRPYRVYSPDGKSVTLSSTDGGTGSTTGLYAAPVRVGDMPNASGEVSGSQSGRIYSVDGKGVPLQARPNGGGADGAATGLYAVPFACDVIITENSIRCQRRDKKHSTVQGSHVNFEDGKSQTLSVAHTPKVIEPIEYNPLQSCDVVVTDQNIRCTYKDGSGTAQGYTVYFDDVKGPSVIAGHAHKMKIIEPATGKEWPVYEVRDGQITIKGKQYPIKLADGFYIIRKLTVTECKRLQTVPEDYIFPVSDTQAYKMLGNGWTVDAIAHILRYAPGITEEPLEVLSMYDGMSCGRLALDKLGANISHYYATEIDKYAVKTTQHNFPDTIQLGDAFQVRDDGWSLLWPERGEVMNYKKFAAGLRSAAGIYALFYGAPRGDLEKAADVIEELAAKLEPSSEPLTLEELREMDGDPVWIAAEGIGRYDVYQGCANRCLEQFYTAALPSGSYGTDWLAYRRKPEEMACFLSKEVMDGGNDPLR